MHAIERQHGVGENVVGVLPKGTAVDKDQVTSRKITKCI
jgi:hypothetical protein